MAEEQGKKTEKKGKRSEGKSDLRETNTGVKVKLFYDPTDVPQFNYEALPGQSRSISLHPWHLSFDVPWKALDDAAVCRVFDLGEYE